MVGGTGAVKLDSKMEDYASLKQWLVMVALADQLAQINPDLAQAYAGATDEQ